MMLKEKTANILNKIKQALFSILESLKKIFSKISKFFREQTDNYSEISFYIITICICAFLLLYYPLGAWLTHKINRDTSIDVTIPSTPQSQTINMISYLVDQEVNEKIWTPNLPFFFPASILDNMPNYQLGMMNSISKLTSSLEKCLDKNIEDKENTSKLYRASTMLRYPGTVWMFNSANKLKPVPSADSQYRKARRMLNKYNAELLSGKITFKPTAEDFSFILKKSYTNLLQSSHQLNSSIRENSSSWFDFKADDVFYYNQGKAYAYYMLFKALGIDYKKIIMDYNQYQNWISLIKALDDACLIQPKIVRNGDLNAAFSSNHLAYLNMDLQKAQNLMIKIITQLKAPLPAKAEK